MYSPLLTLVLSFSMASLFTRRTARTQFEVRSGGLRATSRLQLYQLVGGGDRPLYPMTSSSAGLERSEDPLATRALTHAQTRSSKDRENVENVIGTMRHGAYPHPTPRAARFSLSLSLLLHNRVTFPLPQSSFISRAFHVFPFSLCLELHYHLLPERCFKLEGNVLTTSTNHFLNRMLQVCIYIYSYSINQLLRTHLFFYCPKQFLRLL